MATASFRLGSTERRYDRGSSTWVDGNTNWFTVQGYRQLAGNIGCSIKKGQRVIIVGRLKMRSWEKEGRIYHVAEIDAESVGHDLMWGSANFTRMVGAGSQSTAAQPEATGTDGTTGQRAGDEQDNDGDAPAAVFIDDATGEAAEVDEETGELKEAAA